MLFSSIVFIVYFLPLFLGLYLVTGLRTSALLTAAFSSTPGAKDITSSSWLVSYSSTFSWQRKWNQPLVSTVPSGLY
jgi:hypothetical protein